MSWLNDFSRERKIVPPTNDLPPNLCYLCGVRVEWKDDDYRASEVGSFVAEDGSFTCPDGFLHQG